MAVQLDHKNLLKCGISKSETRRKLFPSYAVGCKRILKSDDYMKAFDNDAKVSLCTEKICKLTEDGILFADGTHVHVDVSCDAAD